MEKEGRRHKQSGGLGFRDIEVFNQALLAKTISRIILQPESLVNQILQAKYVGTGNWAGASMGHSPSFIWKSLVWGKELLCAGIRMRVGDGRAIQIWGEKWIPKPWSFQVVTPKFLDGAPTVDQLMERPGMWNIEFLRNNFVGVDVDNILSIPLCDQSGSDVAIWHYTKDGYYTVKSGYWLGMKLQQLGRDTGSSGVNAESNSKSEWSIIWDLAVPNKVKLFLSRACHAFLPCVERLFKRKVTSSDICSRCDLAAETVLHCLWECLKARRVWKCTWLAGVVKSWRPGSFPDLLCQVERIGTVKELEFFVLLCWWLWKCRNDVIHGKTEVDPGLLVQRCFEWQEELAGVYSKADPIQSSPAPKPATHQDRSNDQISVDSVPFLYFDGATNKNGEGVELGAIILRPDKHLVGAFSIPLPGPLSPEATEGLALWHRMKYCKELGLEKVRIRGDALNVLKGLEVNSWDLSPIGGVLDAVRRLSSEFVLVSWKHVKKRFNQIAHRLARESLKLSEGWFYQEVGPLWLHNVIAED